VKDLLDLCRVGLLLFRKIEVLLAMASISSMSSELKPGDKEPLNLFPFFPRNIDRRPVWRSMKLWPGRWRRSCDDLRDVLSCPTNGGATDMKEEVAEAAVLLLDRRVKTELLLAAASPGAVPAGRSGEGRSA
jgi:hypothetical protein